MSENKYEHWQPKFTPVKLKKVPVEFQSESEKLKVVHEGFERICTSVFPLSGLRLKVTYVKYLKCDLVNTMVWLNGQIDVTKKESVPDAQHLWWAKSLLRVLESVLLGHEKIDLAFEALLAGNKAEFAGYLSEAGVYFGRLTMVSDLIEDGIYSRIGSIQSAIQGASVGGKRSGETRRNNSRLPIPSSLRAERDRLLAIGKPSREVSAMLASKYGCTSDYIRKHLKRE